MSDQKDVAERASQLKQDSRDFRDKGDYASAEATLTEAIALLTPVVEQLTKTVKQNNQSAELRQSVHDAADELADLQGSLGGILRRQGRLFEALAAYRKGAELEQDACYAIDATYNQVQAIVLTVLTQPDLIHARDDAIHAEIDRVSKALLNILKFARPRDSWARSDLGLLLTLKGDEAGAETEWRRLDKLNPIRDVYQSGLSALKDIRAKLIGFAPVEKAVAHFEAALTKLSQRRQRR